jgi:hypothetical protein
MRTITERPVAGLVKDAKGDTLRLQPINDFAQMPDRARQAVNFRDNQGIAYCRFKLFTRRDRAYVLAELSSPRFQIPNLRFKTGDCSMVEVLP